MKDQTPTDNKTETSPENIHVQAAEPGGIVTPSAADYSLNNHTADSTDPTKHSSKKLLLVILFVALIGAAFLVRALGIYESNGSSQSSATTQSTNQSPGREVAPTKPFAIAYGTAQEGTKTKDCSSENTQLSWQAIAGGASTDVKKVDKSYTSDYEVYKNRVFVITEPSCGNAGGPAILFSRDAGKSYTKIYAGKPLNKEGEDQITSAKFSHDGKRIVIATLLADRSKNIIAEINPDTKAVKELFSVEKAGVFIKGYSADKKQLFYYDGCYNCDGNTNQKLFVRDLEKNTDAVLFDTPELITEQTIPNKDLSKFLLVKGTDSDQFQGTYPPFTIQELDVATKTLKTILTIKEDVLLRVGYSEDEGLPWYANGKKLYSLANLANAANAPVLYEAPKLIYDVHYLAKDRIIASLRENSEPEIVDYTVSTKSTKKIFTSNAKTRLFGVTWK